MKSTVWLRNNFFSVGMIVFFMFLISACTPGNGPGPSKPNEALTFIVDHDDNDTFEVWIMRTDGSIKVMLADNPDAVADEYEGAVQQTMSPDGRTLVYVLQGPRGQMVSKDLNTGVVTVLVDDTSASFDPTPSYSYDGTKIAYSMNHSSAAGDGIRVMNADGTDIQVLTTLANDTTPAFNRSGDLIVFDRGRNGDLYVINTDGSGLALVKAATVDFTYGHPQFLPDGRIVCMRVTSGETGSKDIVIMDADGSNEINLTPGTDDTDEWSPTVNKAGDKIAFSTNRNGGTYDIYVGTLSGDALTDLQNLTADVDYDCWRPRFGPVPSIDAPQ